MSEIMDLDAEPGKSKPASANLSVRRTLFFTEDDWARIERTAQVLAEQTHGETDVPGLIRGTLRRRCDEILGAAA